MPLTPHRISREDFLALARGGGGSRALDQLAAGEFSKHVLLIRGVIDAARQVGHDQAGQARQAYDLLVAIQDRYPEAVEIVIRHPAVGAWARRTLANLWYHEAPQGEPIDLGCLAAAAAVRASTSFGINLPVRDGTLTLPSLGRLILPKDTNSAFLKSTGRKVDVYTDNLHFATSNAGLVDLPEWQPMRSILLQSEGMSFSILIDDVDPYRMAAVPPTERLTSVEFVIWKRRLADAWNLLVRHHRATAIEICHAIRVVTPVRPSQLGSRSLTSHETFGAVGMSLPSDGLSAAITLAHEVQHAKLSALLDQMTLTQPDDGRRFYAPWRADPRPISGLLQGAYAFMGVTEFWRRHRHVENEDRAIHAHAEFARWRKAAKDVAEALMGSGSLTPDGDIFVTGMLATLEKWSTESVPVQAAQIAKKSAAEHLAYWHQRNPRYTG